jgi:hypothetical protein
MASIFLKRRELGGRLPEVCVVCGRRGHLTHVTLSHTDSGFPFASGIRITTFLDTRLPLCSSHEDYFVYLRKYQLMGFAFLLLLMLIAVACFFLVGLGAFAGAFLLFFVCAAVVITVNFIVTMSRTRASSIEDRGVQMTNVSEAFLEAVEDLRDGTPRARYRSDDERPRRRAGTGIGIPTWVWLAGGGAVVLVLLLMCGGVGIILLTMGGGNAGVQQAAQPGAVGQPMPDGQQLAAADPIRPPAPRKVTEANFKRLKGNMTQAEVVAILGPPREDLGPGAIWMEGRNNIQVHFLNDRLVLATGFINGRTLSVVGGPVPPGHMGPLPPPTQ